MDLKLWLTSPDLDAAPRGAGPLPDPSGARPQGPGRLTIAAALFARSPRSWACPPQLLQIQPPPLL